VTRRFFLAAAARSALAQNISKLAPSKAPARIPYGKAAQQFGNLYLPQAAGPHPAVIFVHGGFWRNSTSLDQASPLCAALAGAGAAVWNLEYRRLGDPGADWRSISDDIIRGAQQLVPVASRYNLDLKRVIAAGHSAGGQLVLWLAAQQAVDLRGVVPLAAISDLRRAYALQLDGGVVGQLLGGSPDRFPERYAASSPMQLLPIPAPQRVLHGTADKVIPFDMSERFAKASGNSRLIPLPGAGHLDLIDPRAKVWPTIQKNILDWEF
jgi:acetyl esterase/lipase